MSDIERGLITVQTNGMQSLCGSVNTLQQGLIQVAKQNHIFISKKA